MKINKNEEKRMKKDRCQCGKICKGYVGKVPFCRVHLFTELDKQKKKRRENHRRIKNEN